MGTEQRILVVGAGMAGLTAARLLAERNYQITIIDQRSHIAGNAYDYVDSNGIRVHQYGPHLFHTSDQSVFDWLSRFTGWTPYSHKVKCLMPDLALKDFPPSRSLIEDLGEQQIIDIMYRPYSEKMWACDFSDISPEILDRVKKRSESQTGYFSDTFQYMPDKGFTEMANRIIAHKNITVELETSYDHSLDKDFDMIFNSMSIDQYHDYRFGMLPYRSIRFHVWTVYGEPLSDVAVVNFTTQPRYTRMTDWRMIPNQPDTEPRKIGTVTLEEPCDFRENDLERYYPVKDPQDHNRELYKKYRDITPHNHVFIGRCGLYCYLDMHQAISSTAAIVKKFLGLNT
jgi:UDP-galactopyranose mutase